MAGQIVQQVFQQLIGTRLPGGGIWGQVGRAVGQQFALNEAAKSATVVRQQDIPIVKPPTMTELMGGEFGGRSYRTGPDGIPLVSQASMIEILGASMNRGGITRGAALIKEGPPAGMTPSNKGFLGEAGPMAGAGAAFAAIKHGIDQVSKLPGQYNDAAGLMSTGVNFAQGPLLGPIFGKIIDGVTGAMGDVMRAPGALAERGAAIVGSAARGENARAVGQFYDGMVDLAAQTPLLGKAFDILGGTVGKVVRSFNEVVMAFVDRGRELSPYSGQLSASYAISDVRQLLADIHEAQTMEGPISRLNDQQTELSLMLRDLLLPIKKFVADTLGDILQNGVEFLSDIKPILETTRDTVIDGLKFQIELLTLMYEGQKVITDPFNLRKIIWDAIRGATEEQKQSQDPNLWKKMAVDLGVPNPGGKKVDARPHLRDMPILKGGPILPRR